MGLIVTHPTGNPFASSLVRGLMMASLLDEVWTGIGFHKESTTSKCLSTFTSIAERRAWLPSGCKTRYIGSIPEIIRVVLERSGFKSLVGLSSQSLIDWVYESFDSKVASKLGKTGNFKGVYSFEDGAANTFKRAKELGGLCFYDLPIPYFKKREEVLGLNEGYVDEPKWKKERKESELLAADHVFVASTFSKHSLTEVGISYDKISVIPYGVDIPLNQVEQRERGEFKILYAGRIEGRKGIHYLLEAFKSLKLKNVSLTLVGTNQDPLRYQTQSDENIYLKKSATTRELFSLYSQADLFVFPTIFDGFGLVILEALSFGVPVIATTNCAGPDIITHGKDGFIVPPKNSDALSEKILWCYENRDELRAMRAEALKTASRFTWQDYESQIADKISEIMANR